MLTHQERYDGLGYPQGLMGERNSARRAHLCCGRYLRRNDYGSPLPRRFILCHCP
ncbi:MAG: hypothetical protein HYS38_05255 [Acidobacteria bacterium]|nr:hypothetical protein [Acidobacteriota bacterium]